MPGFRTRARAWFLRTFKGRSREQAGWTEEQGPQIARIESFAVGSLTVTASSLGMRAAGANEPAVVYEVRITKAGDSRSWASRYGLAPGADSPAAAAEVALDELWQLHTDPDGWMSQATSGMSADEAEAMADSPMLRLDLKGTQWIGPELEPLRAARADPGGWLERS